MVTADITHINPADYFAPDAPIPEQPLIHKYFYPVGFPVIGVLVNAITNYITRRPPFSGIQLHILIAAAGLAGGLYANRLVEQKATKRDSIIYHYIITHPDDFKPEERIKYKDVLNVWAPVR